MDLFLQPMWRKCVSIVIKQNNTIPPPKYGNRNLRLKTQVQEHIRLLKFENWRIRFLEVNEGRAAKLYYFIYRCNTLHKYWEKWMMIRRKCNTIRHRVINLIIFIKIDYSMCHQSAIKILTILLSFKAHGAIVTFNGAVDRVVWLNGLSEWSHSSNCQP